MRLVIRVIRDSKRTFCVLEMPRASKQEEYASPTRPKRSGSKQLTEDLSKDELLKRLQVSDILFLELFCMHLKYYKLAFYLAYDCDTNICVNTS